MTRNQFWTKFTNLLLWYAGVNFCIASTIYLATRLAEIPLTLNLHQTLFAIVCGNVLLPLSGYIAIRSFGLADEET